jgi:hypothetical protein
MIKKRILILILLLILILFIINNNNTNENLDVSNNIIHSQLTTKSNEAIQNLASMYNNNMLYGTRANIPDIITTNISTDKLCINNNSCINDTIMNRINNIMANDLIYYKDQIVLWDDINKYMNYINFYPRYNKIKNTNYVLTRNITDNSINIPQNFTMEITVPEPPKNTNYDYTVIWLNIPVDSYNFIEISNNNDFKEISNNNDFKYAFYIINIDNTYVDNDSINYRSSMNYYNNLLKNNENFRWIPIVF